MAAYAALLSLARTTDLSRTQNESIFSSDAVEMVRSIHVYVNFLLSFFEEFPEKVNRWECRIRDVAYDAEDIIEVFVWLRIQSRRDSKIYSPVILEDQLQDVTLKIGSIAGEVMEERPAYRPPSSSSRLAAAGNDAVVGLDDDVMAIKERLCGESSNLQVIPIVGMGGIGKSTLARTLYDDQLIVETFHIRAWVVVSQDYNPHRFRTILLDLMRLLDKEQMWGDNEMDDSEIALKVYKNLKGRRYLIVIDDVWSTNVWDDVRYIFPDDNNGSRVMLTTRQLDVATYPDPNSPVHKMQFMNDAQSWDLLKLKVFGNGNCPSELEEVGEVIARKCAGLPLAVVLVAGVLSPVSKTRASWEEIAKNVNPAVGREIEEILSLSYTYLPHHLRPCFLFIGYFVEDVNIRSSRLIKLWLAEGFVKHQTGCSLEDEAEECLEDLVKRNLVIVTSRKSDGKIKSCSLHDMVRGLCMSKAHEEKFLHVRDGRYLPLMNKRRIIFSHSDENTVWGAKSLSILGFQVQNIPILLQSYKLLRVLDALGVNLKELPSEAFELYHLRYLAVMGSFSIPSLVYNLVNLQTLIVHLVSGILQRRFDGGVPHSLPLDIWRMPQLRHLFFHAPYILPHPLEGINYVPLENLQTLGLVKDLVWNENIIRMIPNVKRLGLKYISNEECHLHHLKNLHHLEKLEVTGHNMLIWREGKSSFPCTLKKLTLVGGGFLWRDMAIVGSLPNLQVLKLLGNACSGDSWETTDKEFLELKVLLINDSSLVQWITHGSPFPTLKHLVLRSCWCLSEIPEGVGEISTLELIEVDSCTKSLLESAKKIKEDQESYGNDALRVRIGHEMSSESRKGKRRQRKISSVQKLYETCKEVFADCGPGIIPSPQNVDKLAAVLDGMTQADVGLRPNMPFFSSECAPIITYLSLHECDKFSIGIFCLPPNTVIPLHNHPGMTIFSKLLFGTMHKRAFDWMNEVDSPKNGGDPEGLRLAKVKVNSELTPPCGTSILYPNEGGNIHHFTAKTACAVLDVLGPHEGRYCQYYQELPFGKISVEDEEEGEDSAWLKEREKPEDHIIVGA